eukprot:COSAG01_NODE_1596_length_9782_cov_16.488692_10_plen_349_part_01
MCAGYSSWWIEFIRSVRICLIMSLLRLRLLQQLCVLFFAFAAAAAAARTTGSSGNGGNGSPPSQRDCGEHNCYTMLGVAHDASDREITKRYHILAKKWHPDKYRDNEAKATRTFARISNAYEILKEHRQEYDNYLKNGRHQERRQPGQGSGGVEESTIFFWFSCLCALIQHLQAAPPPAPPTTHSLGREPARGRSPSPARGGRSPSPASSRQKLNKQVLLQTLAGHSLQVKYAQFSPDGQKIVSASWDKTVRVWSAATGECVQTLAGHSDGVFSAQFSPDGQKIVSASSDRMVRVWSAATGECVQTLAGHSLQVKYAQFSPDGQKIVSASWDKTVRVWSAATGECVQTL